MPEKSTAAKVLDAFQGVPQPSLKEIAVVVGVSRERVRQILKANGLKSTRRPMGRPPGPSRVWQNRFGYPIRVSTMNLGAVSELVVAADLLARGYDVYRAVAGNCGADLVAISRSDGSRYVVEVRSATVNGRGTWVHNPKSKVMESYDVFALVSQNLDIRYNPDPFTGPQPVY